MSARDPGVSHRQAEVGIAPPPPGYPWTILHLIRWSGAYLEERGVEAGRFDAEHLLADALGIGRLELYLQHDRPLTGGELAAYKPRLLRRARREPLQYILGRTAFREIELHTDRRVFIPRPETEMLVEVVLDWAKGRDGVRALDLGTGSGAIGLSLASEGDFAQVVATDISSEALAAAGENARAAGLEGMMEFREGHLFEPMRVGELFDVVVSNPPYIATLEEPTLEPEVREWEPKEALFAGSDGLGVLAPLIRGAAPWVAPGGLLAVEMGAEQADAVGKCIEETGCFGEIEVRRDLSGRNRIALAAPLPRRERRPGR